MDTIWHLHPDDRITRPELHARYGGSRQSGISVCARTPNILLFSDLKHGRAYGYDFDGWTEDRAHFLYTGEGQLGPQTLTRGNLALSNHRGSGRAVRLFNAVGRLAGRGAQIFQYLGQFELDPSEPWVPEDGVDRERVPRTVLVFRLRPLDAAVDASAQLSVPDISVTPIAEQVELEAHTVSVFPVPATPAGIASKREAELVQQFATYLQRQGHTVGRWRLRPPKALQPLLTDIYDQDTSTLYEAKASATRDDIRMLVGQLLDYRRHIPVPGLQIAALLPNPPAEDLLELIHSIGASCVWRIGDTDSFYRSDRIV